jgi:hypothetical protein
VISRRGVFVRLAAVLTAMLSRGVKAQDTSGGSLVPTSHLIVDSATLPSSSTSTNTHQSLTARELSRSPAFSNFVVDTVDDVRKIPADIGFVICRGHSSAGDGGGGTFVWNSQDGRLDDNAVILASEASGGAGRWIRQDVAGVIDVRWFGAKGDSKTDDSQAFKAACQFAMQRPRNQPQIASNPLGSVKIRVPAGTYLIRSPEALLARSWTNPTFGLEYEGLGPGLSAISYEPVESGPLFYNNNAVLFLRISGILFASKSKETFYEAVSSGKAQDVHCSDVAWSGAWGIGFKLSGTNTNSEYKWTTCTIAGEWDYFLDLEGNDQLLNYWFLHCKVWLWGGGGWIRSRHGGHIKISNCDVSAWEERQGRPLFALLGTSHARGVCHFLCIGTRFEIKNDSAPIIHSQWPHGVVAFINADFGSQSPSRPRDYVEAIFDVGPGGHAMIRWQDCTHIGRHLFRANIGGAPASSNELYHFVADRFKQAPCVVAEYSGCTHLAASTAYEMITIEEDLKHSPACPFVTFSNCRTELLYGFQPPVPWSGNVGWQNAAAAVLARKVVAVRVRLSESSSIVGHIPQGSLITKVQLSVEKGAGFMANDRIALAVPGAIIVSFDRPAKLPEDWSGVIAPGRYLIRVVVRQQARGTITILAEHADLRGVTKLIRGGVLFAQAEFRMPGRIELSTTVDFDGNIEEVSVRDQSVTILCDFSATELEAGGAIRDGLSYDIPDPVSGLLTVFAQIAGRDLKTPDRWARLMIDYLG